MGKTYSVPRNVKGESRILYIFSIKSLLTTIALGIIGYVLKILLTPLNLGIVGWIITIAFAGIGYALGSVTIPDSHIVGNLRKAGGEQVLDILIRTVTFFKRKKIYVYREGVKK